MEAKLIFEYDGKVEKIWTLHCSTDAINTFELLKMGYVNETYLKDIAKQFDPEIEVEDRKTTINYAIDLLERLTEKDNKIIELKGYLKKLEQL